MTDNELAINYERVLADLRAKRDKIDAAIAGIEAMMGIASQGAPEQNLQSSANNGSQEVESDSFFGMSIPDASRKFLAMRRKPQTTQEIANALDRGGLTHQSGDFANTVGSVLNRIERGGGDVVKLDRAKWGLAAWYPNRKKKSIAQKSNLQELMEDSSGTDSDGSI